MKILIDMNLSPRWVEVFRVAGWESVHWSEVGKFDETDAAIMAWAREHGYILFTHDLDFGALLAATQALGPSVVQVRTQDVMPEDIGTAVVKSLTALQEELRQGALIVIEPSRARVRVLPFRA